MLDSSMHRTKRNNYQQQHFCSHSIYSATCEQEGTCYGLKASG